MKNTITQRIITLGAFALVLVTIFAFVTINESSSSASSIVNADIVFGRGPNCTSRGICSVDEPGDSMTGNILSNNAQIQVNSNGQTEITIFKDAISVSTMETQFVNGYFEQEVDILIPNYFSDQTGSDSDFEIEIGTYQVIDLGDRYTISF